MLVIVNECMTTTQKVEEMLQIGGSIEVTLIQDFIMRRIDAINLAQRGYSVVPEELLKNTLRAEM